MKHPMTSCPNCLRYGTMVFNDGENPRAIGPTSSHCTFCGWSMTATEHGGRRDPNHEPSSGTDGKIPARL